MKITERVFSILFRIFFIYALLAAFGSGIFPATIKTVSWDTRLVQIFLIISLSYKLFSQKMVFYSKSEEKQNGYIPQHLKDFLNSVAIGFVVGIILLSFPKLYSIFSNLLTVLWNRIPAFAQISPYISILFSFASFLLSILTYRIQVRKDKREAEEFMSRKTQRDSKIITPTNEEILKYTKK